MLATGRETQTCWGRLLMNGKESEWHPLREGLWGMGGEKRRHTLHEQNKSMGSICDGRLRPCSWLLEVCGLRCWSWSKQALGSTVWSSCLVRLVIWLPYLMLNLDRQACQAGTAQADDVRERQKLSTVRLRRQMTPSRNSKPNLRNPQYSWLALGYLPLWSGRDITDELSHSIMKLENAERDVVLPIKGKV